MDTIWSGFRQYGRGFPLLAAARIWPLVLVPALLSLAYIPALLFFGWMFLGATAAYVTEHWMPHVLDVAVVRWLVLASLWVAALYLGFNFYRTVVMICYSPVLGKVSVRTEQTAQPDLACPEPKVGLAESALRGTSVSLASLFLEISSLLFCWALLLIPVIGGILMVVLLPLCQMFLAGQGFLDPALERRGKGVFASFGFAWRHRGRTLGCGAGFVLITLVPVIGWILGPPLGIISGTLIVGDLLPGEQEPDGVVEPVP